MLNPLSSGATRLSATVWPMRTGLLFWLLKLYREPDTDRLFRLPWSYLNDILSGIRAFTIESDSPAAPFMKRVLASRQRYRGKRSGTSTAIHIVPVRYKETLRVPHKAWIHHDCLKITPTMYRLAKKNNLLFYFGLIGVIIFWANHYRTSYVIYEWFAPDWSYYNSATHLDPFFMKNKAQRNSNSLIM